MTTQPVAPQHIPPSPNNLEWAPAVTLADQLRADALRWILAIADNHHLPLPAHIETHEGSYGWRLHLHLDDDQGDQVHRWGAALNLPMETDLCVNGTRQSWTAVSAGGPAPEIVFPGWDYMRIDSYCDHTAATATPIVMVAA